MAFPVGMNHMRLKKLTIKSDFSKWEWGLCSQHSETRKRKENSNEAEMNVFWAPRHITPKWCFLVPWALCASCVARHPFSSVDTRVRIRFNHGTTPVTGQYKRLHEFSICSAVWEQQSIIQGTHSTIFIFVLKPMRCAHRLSFGSHSPPT